jgi:endonuclease YncB( thermonuclease family)
MRTREIRFTTLVAILCLCAFVACDQPTKPIKKLDIKRASDLEPISPPPLAAEPETAGEETAQPGEEMEVVEVAGFRGNCDSVFAGVNAEDLVTLRSGPRVGTYRLAGISIPAEVQFEAHNQLRMWLEGKNVSLEVDESVPAIDPAVYIHSCSEGTIVNEELVRAGLAMPSEARFRRSDALKKASVEALTAGRGVWGTKAQ